MWYRVTYTKDTIRPHLIHEDLLDIHHRYILERYKSDPELVEKTDNVLLDPGGMIAMATEPEIIVGDEYIAEIKAEHICIVSDYFFNKEIYEIIKEAYDNKVEDPKVGVRFLSDDCIKVYMQYYVVVMKPEHYLDIASKLDDKYMSGLETYFKIIESMSSVSEIQEITYYFPNIEPAEA
tara:strand:+ start:2355 stop:2891 length:537 start_codon:yes stop_codon:yes gene_type:complete